MVVKDYKWSLLVVVACTFITPVATLSSTLFTKTLIDDYIIPLTQAAQPDYTPLAMAIGKLAVILTAGALCAYLQSRTSMPMATSCRSTPTTSTPCGR